MAGTVDQPGKRASREALWSWVGTAAAALWIFGGALYFLVHFTSVFYASHKESIDAAVAGLGEMVGLT